MPNGKFIFYALAGAMAAAVVAAVVGIIIYFPALNSVVESGAANYSALVEARARKILAGLILMVSGDCVFAVSTLCLMIYGAVRQIKRRKDNN